MVQRGNSIHCLKEKVIFWGVCKSSQSFCPATGTFLNAAAINQISQK